MNHGVARKSGGSLRAKLLREKEREAEEEAAEQEAKGEPEAEAVMKDDKGVPPGVKKGGKVKKQVGGPVGAPARAHGGRAARKSGGGCEASPFSSAHGGTAAPGRKLGKGK